MKRAAATLKRKGFAWYATGHAWVYRDDLARVENASPGDIVDLLDPRGRLLGRAFYGDRSKIALRLLTRNDEPVDDAFFERRVREAVARRRPLMEEKGALRLIYSEADGLPGLIADRYADWIVLQSLIPGSDSRVGLFASILRALLDPKGIVLRNDASARALEGLPLERKVLTGDLRGPVEVVEGDIRYLADILNGHKTGAYLDQREHRELVGRLARGKALDCFCYQGHFALHCAQRAEAVTALESSREAIAAMEKNIALNGFSNVTPVEGNAFDLLRAWQRERKRFDTIVVDPPPLARKKAHAADAMRGYKEINLRALKLVRPGGFVVTCSCSQHVSDDAFQLMVNQAARDGKKRVRLVEARTQATDHPILPAASETKYLKCMILQVME